MVFGLPNLSQSFVTFPADNTGAFRALYALSNGMGAFSFLSIGVWAILTGIGAVQTECLNPAVSYFGILFGLSALAPVLLGAVVSANILFGISTVIGIIWFVWLGIDLVYVPAGQMAMETCSSMPMMQS